MRRWWVLLVLAILLGASPVWAQEAEVQLPGLNLDLGRMAQPEQVSVLLQIVFLLTVLSLAPAIMVVMTSFTRLVVVFSFLRQAIGTQQMPPNQVLISLALFLTFYIMAPVWSQVNSQALQPYLDEQISGTEALKRAQEPVRAFMFKQTREKDLALLVKVSGQERPARPEEVSTLTLIPAFIISELKTAFQIGFILYVPFLIIDMVVASVLLSMGMMMLPPILISLPFKLMIFVLVDGWYLVVGSLVRSFS
ncbi:MAG: flagellar type III secretion system pore protein FliP [Deltaproteobacteria bacterium]|nr:flagellar type III secretion system pore protein FliP [Deltaproteobacteria bacterium]